MLDYLESIFKEIARELEEDKLVKEFVGRRLSISSFMSAQRELLSEYLRSWDNSPEDFALRFEHIYDSFGVPYTVVAWSIERTALKLMDKLLSEGYSREFVLRMRSYMDALGNQIAKLYLKKDSAKLVELKSSPFSKNPLYRVHVRWISDIAYSIGEDDMSSFPLMSAHECEFTRVMGFPESLFACIDPHMCGYINKLHETLHDTANTFYALYNKGAFLQAYVLFKELAENTTKLLKTISELYFLAYSDPETNFFRLVQVLSAEKGYKYVSLIDIRGLNSINRSHGRELGDEALRVAEGKLKSLLRGNEDRTLLVSGSTANFFVLYVNHSPEEIEKLTKDISRELNFTLKGVEVKVSVATLEIEPYEELTETDLREILSFLKEEAKGLDRGVSLCAGKEKREEILSKVNEKYRSIEKVRRKVKDKDIELVFHPIVECGNVNRVCGVETLVRLVDNGKLVPAGVFIDVIYELNLIDKVDRLVLEKLRDYESRLAPVRSLYINVGSTSLDSKEYIRELKDFIRTTEDMDIIIELTEQQLLENVDAVVNIAEVGKVAVAVDDFGTGYSSLKIVADLVEKGVLKVLKIDGSLIKSMLDSRSIWKVVDMISVLSKRLETRTVAEFVETQEDLSAVRNLGIDMCQGYYIAKPMTLHELLVWLKSLG